MNLFRVYAEWTITTWEFGFGIFFDRPVEIEFLLGPLSIGIVFGENEESKVLMGDVHDGISISGELRDGKPWVHECAIVSKDGNFQTIKLKDKWKHNK